MSHFLNPFFRLLPALGLFLLLSLPADSASASEKPNFVIIFLDDSGWGDFHPFGSQDYPTPNVEKLAAEGCRYDNFYVPQGGCPCFRYERGDLLDAVSPCWRSGDFPMEGR